MRGIGFDLLAQLTDEDTQVFGLFRVLTAPNCAEQGAMRKDFAAILEEVNEQVELFRREVNFLLADKDFVRGEINHKITIR